MAAPGNAWFLRRGAVSRGRWRVACYQSNAFPDGTVIDESQGAQLANDAERLWSADLDHEGRTSIQVTRMAAPSAPDAWFVALAEDVGGDARTTLVAFSTDHLPDGTIVTNSEFFTMPIRSASQSAAIRWCPDTAVVDEIYVQADYRRTHLGTKLIYAASGYHQHHGWPDRLHSDGRRTDLGNRFVVGLRHPQRMAPWTERAAPMDRDA